MSCQIYQRELLEAAGTSSDVRRSSALAAHLECCAACGTIAELLRTETSAPAITAPAALCRDILGKTIGIACSTIGDRLVAFAEASADADVDERQLVEHHLRDCPSCTAIVDQLVSLPQAWIGWDELCPDERFVADVLAATTGRTLAARRRSWTATWQRLLLRPRLAWEAAYVGAMVLWLVLGVSSSVSGSSGIAPRPLHSPGVFQGLRTSVGWNGQQIWRESSRAWSTALGRLAGELEQGYRSAAGSLRDLSRRAPALDEAARMLDGRPLSELAADVRELAASFVTAHDTTHDTTDDTTKGESYEPQP